MMLYETNQAINEAAISFQNQEKEVNRLTDANSLYESRVKEREDRIQTLKQEIAEANKQQNDLSKQNEVQKAR